MFIFGSSFKRLLNRLFLNLLMQLLFWLFLILIGFAQSLQMSLSDERTSFRSWLKSMLKFSNLISLTTLCETKIQLGMFKSVHSPFIRPYHSVHEAFIFWGGEQSIRSKLNSKTLRDHLIKFWFSFALKTLNGQKLKNYVFNQ
jgi:hypothetical protein